MVDESLHATPVASRPTARTNRIESVVTWLCPRPAVDGRGPACVLRRRARVLRRAPRVDGVAGVHRLRARVGRRRGVRRLLDQRSVRRQRTAVPHRGVHRRVDLRRHAREVAGAGARAPLRDAIRPGAQSIALKHCVPAGAPVSGLQPDARPPDARQATATPSRERSAGRAGRAAASLRAGGVTSNRKSTRLSVRLPAGSVEREQHVPFVDRLPFLAGNRRHLPRGRGLDRHSIFIDSRITHDCPSATSSPIFTSIFQTVPVMCAATRVDMWLLCRCPTAQRITGTGSTAAARRRAVDLCPSRGSRGASLVFVCRRLRKSVRFGQARGTIEPFSCLSGWLRGPEDGRKIWPCPNRKRALSSSPSRS